ncbi:ABC transporter ATP-binding protein [Leucobacter rhizosphaerae]|uniref:ABC transporter ATP-binding protein n=1 Tax=Leucobacter rhizosphaerae TaxID=2932245 RepID=A0ABY4FXY8_9MICO|nr:ABC transporter ATP-binding protein [Leucobacter rhizosphaerae]UOQ61167.1 ABC transporter ATP-binding protein [Leucobacter rhizosphaerae]
MTALVVDAVAHAFRAPGAGRAARRAPRTPVLSEVSFAVEPGTLTALVGPSGCGKSTLLRVLAGLLVPELGSARIGGRDLVGRPGGVAYHPQRDALLPWLRAIDNMTLGAETAGRDRAAARAEALGLLERFGLAGQERAWPDELSGGMRQRVALLRTFLMPQPALVLDEPLGALDALTRRRLQHWLLDLTASDRRPILLVTHDIEEALLLADRVLVLSDRPGRVVHVEERPDAAGRTREQAEGSDRAALRRVLAALDGRAA